MPDKLGKPRRLCGAPIHGLRRIHRLSVAWLAALLTTIVPPVQGQSLTQIPDRVDAVIHPASIDGDVPPTRPRCQDLAPLPQSISIGKVSQAKKSLLAGAAPRPGTPHQVGFGRDVPQLGSTDATAAELQWQPTAQGGMIAAISITSPQATGLRLGIQVLELPAEATLRFYAQRSADAYEVSGKEILETIKRNLDSGDHGGAAQTYWSPHIEGEETTLEIELPAGIPSDKVKISIPSISHFFSSPLAAPGGNVNKIGQAASCELDSTCYAAWSPESNATAKISYVDAGTSYVCSGTLLNDKASSATPYFLSAYHCVSTQTVASTLQSYWFYRSASCNGGSLNPGYQIRTGGATLLYAAELTDTSFLKLSRTPPGGATYAGWSANPPTVGVSTTGLHHPQGDMQKISFGNFRAFQGCTSTTSGTFECSDTSQAGGKFLDTTYTSGTTEGGSSGSGLFMADGTGHYLIGQLRGGSSSCTNLGGANVYGRFDLAYAAALNQWLNSVDTTAPSVPTGVSAKAAGTTQVNLTWTASTDNVGVTAYKIYRGGTLLATLANVTSYSDTGLTAATTYGYTVAACDAAGNCSAQSSTAFVATSVINALSTGTIYNIPSPTNIDQPFLRFYNTSSGSGQVRGTLYDQSGGVLGNLNSILLASQPANSVAVLTAADIANAVGVATWSGRAWLSVQAEFSGLRMLNLIRSSLLLSMSCVNSQFAYYLPNPASTEQPYVRLYNPSTTAGAVRGTLYDEGGNVLGSPNAVLVPSLAPNAVQVLGAADIAAAFNVSSWSGRAWMSLTSDFAVLKIMNTLRDLNTNTLVNVSCDTGTAGVVANVYNIPPTTSATAATIRIYNTSSNPNAVTGTLYAEDGGVLGKPNSVLGNIPSHGVLVLSQSDVAGMVGAGAWTGRAWMEINAGVSGMKVLALTKQTMNMDMSCVEGNALAFNIPDAGNTQDQPYLRIYNTSSASGNVYGTLYDQNGNVLGNANSLLASNMPAKSVAVFSAGSLASAMGASSWTGRAWMRLSSSLAGLKVMDILQDMSTGTWSNMSCATN